MPKGAMIGSDYITVLDAKSGVTCKWLPTFVFESDTLVIAFGLCWIECGSDAKSGKDSRQSSDTFSGHKTRPNHRAYLEVLRRMTPEKRLLKAFELSDMTKDLFRQGLRERFPDMPEEQFQALYLERLALCHNRNY